MGLNTGFTYDSTFITDPDKRLVAMTCRSIKLRRRPDLRQAITDAVDEYGWGVVAAYLRSVDVVPSYLCVLQGQLRVFGDEFEVPIPPVAETEPHGFPEIIE